MSPVRVQDESASHTLGVGAKLTRFTRAPPSTLGFSIFAMQLMAVPCYFPRDSLLALGQSSGNAAGNLGWQAQRQMGLCPGRQTVPLQS